MFLLGWGISWQDFTSNDTTEISYTSKQHYVSKKGVREAYASVCRFKKENICLYVKMKAKNLPTLKTQPKVRNDHDNFTLEEPAVTGLHV